MDHSQILTLTETEKDEWVEYNKVFRFGCALFVDNECVYRGYLSVDDVAKVKLPN